MSGGSLPHFLNCIIEVDMLGNWKNPHFGSLTHEVRALVEGRAHWKFLELPLYRDSKLEAILYPWGKFRDW